MGGPQLALGVCATRPCSTHCQPPAWSIHPPLPKLMELLSPPPKLLLMGCVCGKRAAPSPPIISWWAGVEEGKCMPRDPVPEPGREKEPIPWVEELGKDVQGIPGKRVRRREVVPWDPVPRWEKKMGAESTISQESLSPCCNARKEGEDGEEKIHSPARGRRVEETPPPRDRSPPRERKDTTFLEQKSIKKGTPTAGNHTPGEGGWEV